MQAHHIIFEVSNYKLLHYFSLKLNGHKSVHKCDFQLKNFLLMRFGAGIVSISIKTHGL